ncbi:hypothetical protein B0A48_17354 [Cryoendolithus antarcticus]|uniref:Uncharacterized protein n=1 Tax=Cryoendolithus antarcticus TaxID=1507870 RepID=A0A1V8SC63_9PEZI|nr:hypothetical protein B0A48_17354 [Cryoendolithus antarcticus]
MLADATLDISSYVTYYNGAHQAWEPTRIPLRTEGGLIIRNHSGEVASSMSFGNNDIIMDGGLPKTFVVPGNWTFANNATFGATPLKDQLFDIQFLDVTPFPIVSDELYYMYLFSLFWPDYSSNPTQADLDNATLSFTFSIIYADGSQDVGSPYTILLRTTLINRFQHMGIRNEDGLPTDRMSLGVYGENDIVADGWIYKQYVVSGNWTMLLLLLGLATAINYSRSEQLKLISSEAETPRSVIPGRNNATYGAIPKPDQLFAIQFLETMPYPINSNDLFFVYLSGCFLPGRVHNLTDDDLAKATVTCTFSIVYKNGTHERFEPWTTELATTVFDRWWHLSLRNSEGDQTKHLTLGDNDLIRDWIIYREYSVARNWTMEFDARISDGRCLFDVSMTHWIDGDYHRRPDAEVDWASKALRPRGR